MNDLFDIENYSGATFSYCRKYRYALWRIWDETKPLIMFIGLNPSTANETKSDPTITRVVCFSKKWGYGGVYMMNLFSLVSTNPKELLKCSNEIGQNDFWLKHISNKCQNVIFAWGDFKIAKNRAIEVTKMFPEGKALLINKNGTPRHPLYVPGNIVPVKFVQT